MLQATFPARPPRVVEVVIGPYLPSQVGMAKTYRVHPLRNEGPNHDQSTSHPQARCRPFDLQGIRAGVRNDQAVEHLAEEIGTDEHGSADTADPR